MSRTTPYTYTILAIDSQARTVVKRNVTTRGAEASALQAFLRTSEGLLCLSLATSIHVQHADDRDARSIAVLHLPMNA